MVTKSITTAPAMLRSRSCWAIAGAASRLTSTGRRGARPWRPPAPALSTSTAHSVSPGSNSTSTPLCQRDARRQRGVDLARHVVDVEGRHRAVVPAHADLLAQAVHLVLQRARHRAVVEDHLLERRAVIAQRARDRIALAGNARRQIGRRLRRRAPCAADLLPAFHHARGIGPQHVGRRARGRGAQHDAAVEQALDMAAQALALGLALDAAREAHARADRMVDEIAAA